MKNIFKILIISCLTLNISVAQKWKSGLLLDEFVVENPPFPESHAATIAESKKGMVAAWFGGTKERNPDVCIWVSRQENGKWLAPQNVANGIVNDTLRYACWNPVLYQIPNGDLMLFYKIGPSPAKWKGWLKTSSDNGVTWSNAKALPEGYIGPVKNKPVLLSNGNLFCPSSTEGEKGWRIHFEVTSDFGKTWRTVGAITADKAFGAIQPSILQHGNGKLQIVARSKNRAILESWSTDNGETWTPLAKTNLPNNNSGTDAVTLKNGLHVLVYNHVLPPNNLAKGPRTPLNLSVSKDGINWSGAVIIEDSPISQYSYPSIIQSSDGLIHVIYTWRRQKIKHSILDPKKFKTKKIKEGIWPAMKGYIAPTGAEITKEV
ncbi:alpha-L-rhamnosidase [Arcicella aurantiaca]|uniref:Alpha-L-rhamnosidase n=1 Tax=Arcicella aurantiaca TaxID=591202 RepID=A0A316ED54_9BACT|nr:sialidase family protein [Arcicella aurantiaca]PWK27559.1 alpha-L-rhamnosidase [Arcicella aurantiaca]